jgi:hypothetical protein
VRSKPKDRKVTGLRRLSAAITRPAASVGGWLSNIGRPREHSPCVFGPLLCDKSPWLRSAAVLNQLLAVVPSEQHIAENEFDDAPGPDVGGSRIVRLVVYADSATETRHGTAFG